eukprot:42174-Eustigmatos_ZCMA.PRE.1
MHICTPCAASEPIQVTSSTTDALCDPPICSLCDLSTLTCLHCWWVTRHGVVGGEGIGAQHRREQLQRAERDGPAQ